MPSRGRIGLLTSGGDAPGMNAALRTATKVALSRGMRVLGIRAGYKGLLHGDVVELDHADVDRIVRWGGTMLGSAREPRFRTPAGRDLAQERVIELGLDAIIPIGGDGTLTGAQLLAGLHSGRGDPLRVVGIPASIDNDVGCTSFAIGVDTAVNTIVDAIDRIADTARAHDRTFIVEVMGRDCGYLAMSSAISSSADAVLFRESGLSHEEMLTRLTRTVRDAYHPPDGRRARRMVLIVKAEGVSLPSQDIKAHLDRELLPELPDLETRVTVLGHLVRGGAPSAQDRLLASRLAYAAVVAAETGWTGVMAAWRPQDGGALTADPQVQLVPFHEVLEETRRLRDGTSTVARKRTELLAAVENILSL